MTIQCNKWKSSRDRLFRCLFAHTSSCGQGILHSHYCIIMLVYIYFLNWWLLFFFFMFIKIFLRLLKNFKFIKILLNSYTNQYVVRCNCCIVYLLPPPVGAQTRRPDSIWLCQLATLRTTRRLKGSIKRQLSSLSNLNQVRKRTRP